MDIVTFTVAWTLLIVGGYGMSKFSPTRVILYWLLWISIVWIFLAYGDIIFAPIATLLNNQSSGTQNDTQNITTPNATGVAGNF